MSFFSSAEHRPLAERVRPETLEEFIGQKKILGSDQPLFKLITEGRVKSLILWGPPGVGKTTLAMLMAQHCQRPFKQLSAIQSGVKDIREVISFARGKPGTVLFIDEIHRFSKSQQDSLLGAVERGLIVLVGATTENPSFEVNSALLSRCQVYRLEALDEVEVENLLNQAIKKDNYLSKRDIEISESGAFFKISGGDARKALNLLEQIALVHSIDPLIITDKIVTNIAQERVGMYDKGAEQHYDIISAFIKSVRGSDPNASIYWLARMLDGGEDLKFIARRLVILASEDIGLANPNALLIADGGFNAVSKIGMPEGRIILAQITIYLASSPKSNTSYMAINNALRFVREEANYGVPLHLRNAPTKLMKDMGYGKGYKYSHNYGWKESEQEYLPEEIAGKEFFFPRPFGREAEMKKFFSKIFGDKYPSLFVDSE